MSTDAVTAAKANLAKLSSLDASDPKAHSEIVQNCQSIILSLQDPRAAVGDVLAIGTTFPCLVALSDMGAFEKLSHGPLTADQLAQQCNADRLLVVRLMRVATAWGVGTETGPESYAATAASNAYATPSLAAGLRYNQVAIKNVSNLPKYLKETQYRDITSHDNGLFQYTWKTKLPHFDWMQQQEHWRRDFNLFMTTPRTTGGGWPVFFNAKDRMFEGVEIDTARPLLVDIAGGFGQDLHHVKQALLPYIVAKGQLVVEDQPSVVSNVPANMQDADFSYIAYDFFTPQPIKGARVYSLKTVLHDWPDEKAVQILRHTAAAMEPGYSKLWILEGVLPDMGADKTAAWLDIIMMAGYGGLERSREQWVKLLAMAGLKIVDVQAMPNNALGLIEAVLDV